jgi:predicted acetyltransferase
MLFLSEPSMLYKESFLEAVREFQTEGRNLELDYRDLSTNFRHYLQGWYDRKANPRPGRVPESTFWLIDRETFIGRVAVRHVLNDGLLQLGGHIGYEIRPTKRRQGYGKTILRLGLEQAKAIGISRALVTCDDTNVGSAKIIEANGGKLENIVLLAGRDVATRRYWIDIPRYNV